MGGMDATGIKIGPCSPGSSKSSSSFDKVVSSTIFFEIFWNNPFDYCWGFDFSFIKLLPEDYCLNVKYFASFISQNVRFYRALPRSKILQWVHIYSAYPLQKFLQPRVSPVLWVLENLSSHLANASTKSITSSLQVFPALPRHAQRAPRRRVPLLLFRLLDTTLRKCLQRTIFSKQDNSIKPGWLIPTAYGDNLVALVDDAVCTHGSGTRITFRQYQSNWNLYNHYLYSEHPIRSRCRVRRYLWSDCSI